MSTIKFTHSGSSGCNSQLQAQSLGEQLKQIGAIFKPICAEIMTMVDLFVARLPEDIRNNGGEGSFTKTPNVVGGEQ